MKPSENLLRQLPDLDPLLERLEGEPEGLLARAFPAEDRLRARALVGAMDVGAVAEMAELPEVDKDLHGLREYYVEAGTRAVRKVRDEGGSADLSPDEITGLEAIVLLEGRPAILIQEGRFFPPPAEWRHLEDIRDSIERTFRSVGRIEVTGHPSFEWVGTAWLVSENVVMTNRHVAVEFARMGTRRRWSFISGITPRIDYNEELSATTPAEFALEKVIGVHEVYDLALLKVERVSSTVLPSPQPLTVASAPPASIAERQVYSVGFPAWDGRRNDPAVMQRIFSNIFDVKRLQPGCMRQLFDAESVFVHDCSTLGGNSGSPIIDVETNRVVGLHFGGKFLQGNLAVALWKLVDDPLLLKAKVNFD